MRSASSPTWLAVGAVGAGLATYVLLIATARAVGAAAYGQFSLFWASVVIVSLGAFLPFEQVVARRVAGNHDPAAVVQLRGRASRLGLVVGLAAAVVYGVVQLLVRPAAQGWPAVVAFFFACLGYGWQFPARGVLAGLRRLRGYAIVVGVDSVGRAVVAVGLWLLGVREVWPYVASVAASSIACGLVGLWFVRREVTAPADPGRAISAMEVPDLGRLAREVGGVLVAMLCMQGMLNSGIVVAGLRGPAEAGVAGHLLAVLTLARLPVFMLQAAQAGYVARIAVLSRGAGGGVLQRWVSGLALAVLSAAVLTVLGAATVGPWLVRLVYGSDYAVARPAVTLVAGGVAMYLLASVTNDVAVALGLFSRTGPAWLAGIVAAAAVGVGFRDLVLGSTLPLLVGATVAGAILVPAVARVIRRRTVRNAA